MSAVPTFEVEPRPIEVPAALLALHHERIEAWILEQAGIVFDAQAEPGKLRVVNT
jgi:hypothetical protein